VLRPNLDKLDDRYLYVIVSGNEGDITLREINIKDNSKIKLLGYNGDLPYTKENDILKIECPKQISTDSTVNKFRVLKIEQRKYVPIPDLEIIEDDGNKVKVEVDNNDSDIDIRYTLDGNTPNIKSKKIKSALVFYESKILKVKTFQKGYAPSLTVTRIIDIPKQGINGVKYKYYEGKNWDKLPNFSTIQSISQGNVNSINIKDIKQREDQFAIQFISNLKILKSGVYNFHIVSDDGSRLIIDGKVIIDNDGSHSKVKKSNNIYLKKGFHKIEIQYFDDTEGEYLKLTFDSNEIPEQEIPTSFLFLTKGEVIQ
jgi:hypothetical protein